MVCRASALVHKVGAVAAEVHRGAAMPEVVPYLQQPIYNSLHSFISCPPIRRSGALQQAFYGSPPPCPVLGFHPPSE